MTCDLALRQDSRHTELLLKVRWRGLATVLNKLVYLIDANITKYSVLMLSVYYKGSSSNYINLKAYVSEVLA